MVARIWRRCTGVLIAMALALGPALADDGYRSVDGLAVYLGIVPAAVVRGHPTAHAESSMHGGAGTARHQQHIVVAVPARVWRMPRCPPGSAAWVMWVNNPFGLIP